MSVQTPHLAPLRLIGVAAAIAAMTVAPHAGARQSSTARTGQTTPVPQTGTTKGGRPDTRAKIEDSRPDAALRQAFTALYAGDPARALQLVSNSLKQPQVDVRVLVLAARAHLARDEHGAAYELLRKALQVDARNADALYFLGIVSGDLATRELDRLYALAPKHARVHQLMARSYKVQGKLAAAAAEYELALQANPNLLEVLIELAAIRREESNCDDATALYERANHLRNTYEGSYGLAMCLAAQNQLPRAIEEFRKALKHDPQSATAFLGLGSSLLQTGDAPAAVRALERAGALQPKMRQAYYLLGRAYHSLGLRERSRQAFARADELALAERAADEKALRGAPAPSPPKHPQ